ncbi:transcriptional attenuator, LytR family [Quadrisphaera granulorum]|uniref:LytR family transcriptional attenuator n=1 Tax=Quadrisphaera granulorum TaxID=317664 RepID=A0A316AR49_9ACTN|nr:LCP family protein [Quadrisphaera granulorum]PWJ52567.1 LytR family transcriptional attenuator [Quadrisphaera granulorum]SZE97617.1 transcriptional attenuator, LytR family [Quadrisphaera granulorum]
MLGTVVPGTGLLNAGRRALGWLALVPFAFVVGAAAVLWFSGRAVEVLQQYVLDADVLLYLAVAAAVIGVAWSGVVVATHLAQRRHRGVTGHRVASALLVAVLLAVVVLPAGTATRYALVSRSLITSLFPSGQQAATDEPTGTDEDPWAGIPRVNVLLVGADTGADRIGTRPDTLIVASINTVSGDTVIFGLPRQLSGNFFPEGSPAAELWPTACEANGGGGCWLNAVYLFGTQNPQLYPGAEDPGLAATEQAAAGVVGMKIDYTAMVNLTGFQDLIDAMGGIRLTVERRIPIGGGERLNSAGRVVGLYPVTGYIEPGRNQLLDGYHAEWYARSRWQSNNNDRMDRQRCLINAAVQQYSALDLARAFPQLAASAERDVSTDIPASRLSAFVDLGRKVKEAPLRSLSFTEPLVNTGDPDYDQIHQLVQQALVPPPPAPSPAPTTTSASPSPSDTSSASASPSGSTSPSASGTESTPSGEAVDAASVCPA